MLAGASPLGVRVEMALSPHDYEVYGACGVYLPGMSLMGSMSRLDGDQHVLAVYQEKVYTVDVGRWGVWGSVRTGGGYIGRPIRKAGVYTGTAVGFYWRWVNLYALYHSVSYVEGGVYRVIGQMYVGLAVEIPFDT